MSREKPIRILHVVGGMNRGGVETWLMHVLRHVDRKCLQMDFLVHTARPGAYDEEIRVLESRILPCLAPHQPWNYVRNFKRIVHDYGPYDVIHSHVHHYSGQILRLAYDVRIPVRIAHSHNDTSALQAQATLPRRTYLTLMAHWINRYATTGLAASGQAATALFGPGWTGNPRRRVLYYGIDLAPFEDAIDAQAIRAELGIPQDAFVLGHVGRFDEQKNHQFILAVAAEVVRRDPRSRVLLVGDGLLRSLISQKVREAGLDDYILFAGLRSDVPRLMRGAMDAFLLPSRYEGLPLVLLEAQAAGLPCFISDVISEEADIVAPLIHRLPLSQAASAWADAILATRVAASGTPGVAALGIVQQSTFNIFKSVEHLEKIYYACTAPSAASSAL